MSSIPGLPQLAASERLVRTGISEMLPSGGFGWRTMIAGLAFFDAITCCSAVISCSTAMGASGRKIALSIS